MIDLLFSVALYIHTAGKRLYKTAHLEECKGGDDLAYIYLVKRKHIGLVLKLNCYRDISVEEELNPPPEKISGIMRERYVYIMVGNSMILSEPDDTHLTLFNPDEELLDLIRSLSPGEGLFVWKP